LLLTLSGGLQNAAAGSPKSQAPGQAAGATAAVAAHIAKGRFAHRADVTMALFGALNALKRPADALAASPSILVALRAALRRHGATHADCAQRLLVQVRNLAGESPAAAATLGDEGFVEAVVPLTEASSPDVCRCAAAALAALTAGCARNAARATAEEASGEAALALAPLFGRLEAAEREMASPSGFDAKSVERTGVALRAAAAALPPHIAATPRARELSARAAHAWARTAMATDGDAVACCAAFRLALEHAEKHPNSGMSVVEVLLPYGQALCQQGRAADAEALLRQALELCTADEATNGLHAWAVCGALGNTMLRAGRLDEALSLWAHAITTMRAAPRHEPGAAAADAAARRQLRITMANACEGAAAAGAARVLFCRVAGRLFGAAPRRRRGAWRRRGRVAGAPGDSHADAALRAGAPEPGPAAQPQLAGRGA
jgi:hypothetical protein